MSRNVGLIVVLMFVMMPIGILLNGLTLSVLWSWFIVAKFGLPTLSIAEALGLSLVFAYFTSNLEKAGSKNNEEEESTTIARLVLLPFLKTGLFLGFGWIVLQFI